MGKLENTNLWKNTLEKQSDHDENERERDILKIGFYNFRERAKTLALEISKVLPNYTVHDITHIDSLWETADLILGKDYKLSPSEVFILGGAFLIHDLGMALASYPKGIDELKQETIWKDTAISILKNKLNREVIEEDLINIDTETQQETLEFVLRHFHAKHAKDLALISWTGEENQKLFLLENSELRNAFGNIIGLIAYSHCWNVEELETNLKGKIGSPGFLPKEWIIDPIKLACILRIADIIQIDDKRAPLFLKVLRKPKDISSTHWDFQQNLNQPYIEHKRLTYTTKNPIKCEKIESWWLCYDVLKLIDEEVMKVDSLLADTNCQTFKVIGVTSIDNPERLSRKIQVDGWFPIETKINVSDIAKLVVTLGGEQLYGKDYLVPIRELIQNASDAIRARRIIEDESESFGTITFRIGKDKFGEFIEIEDDGVGMSKKVLTGPFLDFGQSFWGTHLMHEELPGLESKGFKSTGQYGIGFFSVFMIGEKIKIVTLKYDEAREKTLVLEFNNGVSSRSILRNCNDKSETIKNGGTRITIWLKEAINLDIFKRPTYIYSNEEDIEYMSYIELLGFIAPSLDCNLDFEENKNRVNVLKANDWIDISPIKLIQRINGFSEFKEKHNELKKNIEMLLNNFSLIKDENGKILGRGCVCDIPENMLDEMDLNGVLTIGGLTAQALNGIFGILIGKSERASRETGIPEISIEMFADWITNQASLIEKQSISDDWQIRIASIIRSGGGNTKSLKIGYDNNGYFNYQELLQKIVIHKEIIIIEPYRLQSYKRELKKEICLNPNVFCLRSGVSQIIENYQKGVHVVWPEFESIESNYWFDRYTLEGLVFEAVAQILNKSIDEILRITNGRKSRENIKAFIGKIDDQEIEFSNVEIIDLEKLENRNEPVK